MESKKTTIHDIASKLGITASTVSRALNYDSRISLSTRDKVIELAKKMNYQPNKLAANLRTGHGKNIGVIVPRINRNFFTGAIAGMESITNPAGYTLMICQTNENYGSEQKSLQSLINNRVDGIIMSVSAETKNSDHIQRVIDMGIKLVQFDRVSNELKVSKVVNDNFKGAYELTKHLLEQGYKRIFHFSGPLHLNVYQERYKGYQQAMEEADLNVNKEMLIKNVLTKVQGANAISSLLESKNLPEAIFSASDFSGIGAAISLQNKGIKIPDDCAIAGFANEPFTEMTQPGMTTVEQFSEKMGKHTAKLLIMDIEEQEGSVDPTIIKIDTKLIIRESSYGNKM